MLATPSKVAKEGDTYSTPAKKLGEHAEACACSVCLSPLNKEHADYKGGVMITRCMHQFHVSCLAEAKIYQPCCPMCRCKLTPVLTRTRINEATQTSRIEIQGQSSVADQAIQPTVMRTLICAAANRGRNAVRLAMQRRELEAQALAQGMPLAVM